MPWNGSGGFTLNQDFPADAVAGNPDNIISSSKFDNELTNIKTGLENCLTLTGETTPTANIPFGNFKLTGVGQGTAKTDGVNTEQVTNAVLNYAGTLGGTATAATATVSTLSTSIPTGALIRALISATTTGAMTLAVNGGAATAVQNFDGTAIAAGDFVTGDYVTIRFDGTNFHIVEPPRDYFDFGERVYNLTSVSGTNTVTASADSSLTALATGQLFFMTAAAANTGAVTLNINSIGATAVEDSSSAALSSGDLSSGKTYLLYYDGTVFRVLTSLGTGTGLIAANNLSDVSSASTSRTNLGLEIGTDVQAYAANLTSWAALAPSAKADASHSHATTDVTSGTFANARVAESNVTQHQAALSVTVSQVSDLSAANAATTNTGTSTATYVTPDGLAGSNYGTAVVSILVFNDATEVETGNGAGDIFWRVPSTLNGYNLVGVAATVATAGTTGTTDIQIHNVTDTADMLSTVITIDSTETDSSTAATPAVINAATDDVATGDILRIDVDAVSTTAPNGLLVELQFRLP